MRHSPSLITSPAHSHPPRPLLSPHQPALSRPVMAISSRPLRCLSAFLSSLSHTAETNPFPHTPPPPLHEMLFPSSKSQTGNPERRGKSNIFFFPLPLSLSLTASHLHTNAPPYLPSAARGALHRMRKTPEVAAHSTLQPLPPPPYLLLARLVKKKKKGYMALTSPLDKRYINSLWGILAGFLSGVAGKLFCWVGFVG